MPPVWGTYINTVECVSTVWRSPSPCMSPLLEQVLCAIPCKPTWLPLFFFFWTVLFSIKQDNKHVFTLNHNENGEIACNKDDIYDCHSLGPTTTFVVPHLFSIPSPTIYTFKFSGDKYNFLLYIFLRFGLTSLVSVSHRAGYPKKNR